MHSSGKDSLPHFWISDPWKSSMHPAKSIVTFIFNGGALFWVWCWLISISKQSFPFFLLSSLSCLQSDIISSYGYHKTVIKCCLNLFPDNLHRLRGMYLSHDALWVISIMMSSEQSTRGQYYLFISSQVTFLAIYSSNQILAPTLLRAQTYRAQCLMH